MRSAQSAAQLDTDHERDVLVRYYRRVRSDSDRICRPLETEDYCIQTMPDVSPAKWHLAHTSWFLETFLLDRFQSGYRAFHPAYDHLFNSYYLTHGMPYSRPQRGLLARPTVAEIYRYRDWVDTAMERLIANVSGKWWEPVHQLVVLGLNHEQQHQELLLTDLKNIFAHNPLRPVYRELPQPPEQAALALTWREFEGGVHWIGHQGEGFGYDNEGPRHRVWLEDFALASRPVTNAEFLEFMNDGGYSQPGLWLSDGWAAVQANGWHAPLYWDERDGEWWNMTLGGMRQVNPEAPVCHVSQYEADAYAAWAGKRLPTEAEWEVTAATVAIEGNLRETDYLQPVVSLDDRPLNQLFGDVWEWTASSYAPYPGFEAPAGVVGEYNGKFMSSQMLLRGGSCATPGDHIRASYRNFFYPKDRWQFSGIRLGDDR